MAGGGPFPWWGALCGLSWVLRQSAHSRGPPPKPWDDALEAATRALSGSCRQARVEPGQGRRIEGPKGLRLVILPHEHACHGVAWHGY